jgi:quinoprotein glucose dehydrogenase
MTYVAGGRQFVVIAAGGERRPAGPKGSSFEDTPILADGRLLACTPTDRVFALDPLIGREIWAFDPKLAPRA